MAAPIGQHKGKIVFVLNRIFCLNIPRQCLLSNHIHKTYFSDVRKATNSSQQTDPKVKKISQAMRYYMEKAKAQDTFMKEEIAQYNIGKRHLANMMGKDPDNFEQADIDMAIEYLLPSGLFDKNARPKMKHPTEVIPKRKAAEFGLDGRPFHPFFYTATPSYYQLMHDIAVKIDTLKLFEVSMLEQGEISSEKHSLLLSGSVSVDKKYLEEQLAEKLTDSQFAQFEKIIERLIKQPYSNREKEFVIQYRKSLVTQTILEDIPPLLYNEAGKPYAEAEGTRKSAVAKVRVTGQGVGQVIINQEDILDMFPYIADREQILFPLQLSGTLGKVDVEGTVELGGPSSQAGAVRLAVSRALQSFVDKHMCEKMRLAGLLTKDPRCRERKKPGQAKARKKFTWKKR